MSQEYFFTCLCALVHAPWLITYRTQLRMKGCCPFKLVTKQLSSFPSSSPDSSLQSNHVQYLCSRSTSASVRWSCPDTGLAPGCFFNPPPQSNDHAFLNMIFMLEQFSDYSVTKWFGFCSLEETIQVSIAKLICVSTSLCINDLCNTFTTPMLAVFP